VDHAGLSLLLVPWKDLQKLRKEHCYRYLSNSLLIVLVESIPMRDAVEDLWTLLFGMSLIKELQVRPFIHTKLKIKFVNTDNP